MASAWATTIAEVAALDGASGIMMVAGSAAGLARIGAVGCRALAGITYFEAVVEMYLLLVNGD